VAIGALLLAYGLISAVLLNRIIHDRLLEEQTGWASTLTAALAEGIVRDTLNADVLLVRETLRNIVQREKRVVYGYVINFEGNLFAHTFDSGFPKALGQLKYSPGKNSLILDTSDGKVLDVAYPLVPNTDAILHLGIDLAGQYRLIDDLQRQRLWIFFGAGLLGLVLAVVLGWQLSRPLDRLVDVMRDFGAGRAVSVPATAGASREIQELRHAFNQMIADRMRLEAALRKSQDELEERVQARTAELKAANSELESFAYSVSHDLRGPLRGIDGFSLALIEEYGDRLDDTGKNYLNRVRSGAQRMSTLIDDLLKLSRLTRIPLARRAVDLSALGREISAHLRESDPTRSAIVTVADDLTAWGDAGLLKVALENLLGNAWKYASKQPQARIEFASVTQDGERVFFVRDNGVGFDMAHAGKLFGPFQRLHHRDQFDGSGIGLATVKRIIERHHGRIWAESAPARGATFYFTLRGSGEIH
jgi:signal transduction histidine kinase